MDEREGIEWQNIWWEKANENIRGRCALLGDSVTRGFRSSISALHENKRGGIFDICASSSQITDKLLYNEYKFFFDMSEWKYDLVVLQAGGQHGLEKRCSDDSEYAARYKEGYIELLDMVLGYCDNVLLLSATPTVEKDNLDKLWEERNREILARNDIVKEVGEEKGIKYIDIFTPLLNCEFVHTDYIHFDKESNIKIADIVYREVENNYDFHKGCGRY